MGLSAASAISTAYALRPSIPYLPNSGLPWQRDLVLAIAADVGVTLLVIMTSLQLMRWGNESLTTPVTKSR